MARVLGYNVKTQRYKLEWLPDEGEPAKITRSAAVVHERTAHLDAAAWVPIV